MFFVSCFLVSVFRISRAQIVGMMPALFVSTDVYNESSSLLYSGKNLAFSCSSCIDCQVLDGRGQVRASGRPLKMVLREKSLSEQYFCKMKLTDPFVLPYLLCEEGSEKCNNMVCDNHGEGNRFCVMEKNNLRPKTCQPLPKTCDPSEKFAADSLGKACVKGRQWKPLCQAFAENNFVNFLTQYSGMCKHIDIDITIPSLQKIVGVGFIGQLGNSIEFKCTNECRFICSEKSPNTILVEGIKLNKTFELPQSSLSAITKISCEKKYHYRLYLYNVRINATVEFKNISISNESVFECKFTNGVDDVDGRIKRNVNVTFFKTGNGTEQTVNSTFTVEHCGVYVCQGTVTVRNCNPFFEATEVSNVSMEVTENCKGYERNLASTPEPTRGPPVSPAATSPSGEPLATSPSGELLAISPSGKPPLSTSPSGEPLATSSGKPLTPSSPGRTATPAQADNVPGKLIDNFVISINILLSTDFMFYFIF